MYDEATRDLGAPAAEPTILQATEPDGAPRIAVLDVLRGIAILGILFMNINDMGGSLWAMFGDFRNLGWTQADQVAWWLREVIANGTARCMLELLFGAGMVILTDRAALSVGKRVVMKRYYLRNVLLFGFGVVHLFILLWPGDILHSYAIAALAAFLFRRMRPRWLITIGLVAAVAQFGGAGYFAYYQPQQERSQVAAVNKALAAGRPVTADDRKLLAKAATDDAKRAKSKAESHARIVAEDKARTGSFATWAAMQWSLTVTLQSKGFELLIFWEAVSVMLIGAALYKLGILQGLRSRGFYLRMTLIAYAVAIPLRIIGAIEQTRFDDAPKTMWATVEVAREAMTLGHVGAVCLLLGTGFGATLLRPFIAAGRTALSIYILQTIICLWILFPPFGLALYGTLGWAGLMATALAINIALLLLANAYVRRFDIAPVEWAWRSLVEGRALPWRKATLPPFSGELRPA
ncbi:hypothetical protein ASE82_11360 [Sphingomonas sp. Leaf230]|uniref:DUF418 domain-containing protein n=1 Tax=Sphingomonas sp. Leaf230 TaxID=1735694 RepID=UPI0006FEC8A2|nr:DUF418 domain-containing protein [Sphingomonas sp. Leaf230]KQN01882.1 hypothetical protein ASE82_11360 [Sphingomonas sp. Leaf230]